MHDKLKKGDILLVTIFDRRKMLRIEKLKILDIGKSDVWAQWVRSGIKFALTGKQVKSLLVMERNGSWV